MPILLRLQQSILTRLQTRNHRHLPPHQQTGHRGELEALFYLRRLGCTVVERRWRTPELSTDIDLIAWDGPTLCFIEVKTRTARDLTPARAAVDASKQRLLIQASLAYLRTLPRDTRATLPRRYDIVSVYLLPNAPAQCERSVDAFQDHFSRAGV